MISNHKISTIKSSDIFKIRSLIISTIKEEIPSVKHIKTIIEKGYCLKLLNDNKIQGCLLTVKCKDAELNTDVFIINYICTENSLRGLGTGRGLLDEAIKYYVNTDIKYGVLYCDKSNSKLISYYEKWGFRQVEYNPESPYQKMAMQIKKTPVKGSFST
jgi:predicted GNAT family N-acyltransferase